MAITIPEEELELSRQLMRSAWIAAGLQNDLFSWEKERETAKQMGVTHVVNGIYILTEEHSTTVSKAKEMCRMLIKENIAEYLRIVKENQNNTELSLDLRRYLEAMQYTLSGNVVWSSTCPRYNSEACYNDFQLSMMQDGLARTLQSCLKKEEDTSAQPTLGNNDDRKDSVISEKIFLTRGSLLSLP